MGYPSRGRHITPQERDAIRDAWIAGVTPVTIADRFEISVASVYYHTRDLPKRGRAVAPCGTRAAFQRHRYRGEEPCEPCVEANRVASAEANRKRRAA